ncbi:MAG: DUF1343 domain-containing protein [Bacteroidales bacterium]|nr:DUF1343 domain-containing protein [Bacteroidales bacterium]
MFSFRTTSLEEQLDKTLQEGRVACFCTQNCWNELQGRYMYDLFRERGNLATVFTPRDTELTPQTNHIEFSRDDLAGLNAVVVEIQDVGARYFNYTRDVFRLMAVMKEMDSVPSLYIVDHVNPAGRVVEGCMPDREMQSLPKIPHRHGLTLGELANLYHTELGAKYPLHVISAATTGGGSQLWAIPPASDIPGMFTYDLYSGGGLWNSTNITPGIGTTRPYEYIGAPFVKTQRPVPQVAGATTRPCSFTPAFGLYAGRKCYGYQIILEPGMEYHSLMHTLLLIHHFNDLYPGEFHTDAGFRDKLADDLLYDYIVNKVSWDEAAEHIKTEEQKWIRKAKKFLLYDDPPYRIK